MKYTANKKMSIISARFLNLASLSAFCSAALLVLSVTVVPRPAWACDCPAKAEIEEALAKSSLVFVGQVKEKRVNPLKSEENEVRFIVSRKLKGFEEVPTSTVLVYTSIDPEFCGYNFSPGMDYLVYATGTPAHFQTSTCSRTEILDKVLIDVHKLIRITGATDGAPAN